MKKYYQCSKCKVLIHKNFGSMDTETRTKNGIKTKVPKLRYIKSIVHCGRKMRELTKEQYDSEKKRKRG